MVKTLQSRIVSGSVVLLTGSGLATAVNLAYNIVVAWFLGPKSFGHATVVYTLITLLSAVSLAFQIVSAKMVAQQHSERGKGASLSRLSSKCVRMRAFCGLRAVFISARNCGLSQPSRFRSGGPASNWGGFYVPLGSRRGYVQGNYEFHRLATNLVLEGIVRLGGSFLLILCGFGVRGVIAANAAAIVAAYFAITPKLAVRTPNPLRFWYALSRSISSIVVLCRPDADQQLRHRVGEASLPDARGRPLRSHRPGRPGDLLTYPPPW